MPAIAPDTTPPLVVLRSDAGTLDIYRLVVDALVLTERFVKVEVAVEVALKLGAVMVLYAVRVFLKSAFPSTSKMLPVVEVAFVPRTKMSLVSVGKTIMSFVVVEKRPLAPPVDSSVPQMMLPDASVWRSWVDPEQLREVMAKVVAVACASEVLPITVSAPEMREFPVVVAPPKMVSPAFCAPVPMVVDALRKSAVVVAFDGNG